MSEDRSRHVRVSSSFDEEEENDNEDEEGRSED